MELNALPPSRSRLEYLRGLDQITSRALFRSRIAHRLSGKLEASTLLQRAVELAVPFLADWCWIDLLREDGKLERAVVGHADPEQRELACRIKAMVPHSEASEAALLGAKKVFTFPISQGLSVQGYFHLAQTGEFRHSEDFLIASTRDIVRPLVDSLEQHRSLQKANQAVVSRERFLAAASHEILGPLAALKLKLGLIRQRADSDELREIVELTEQDVDQLSRLTHRVLDFSRLQAGRLTLDPSSFDLSLKVESVIQSSAYDAAAAGSSIISELERSIEGEWDAVRIEQVIRNLLSNAIKYGRGKPIVVRLARSIGFAELEITDQGIGIPEHELSVIFDPFTRASTAQGQIGTGLGLYIVQQLVQAHGGEVRVQSRPGQGSSFLVRLPI